MSIEPARDERRLRWALLFASLALAGVWLVVWLGAGRVEWRALQQEYRSQAAVPADRELGIQQFAGCSGEVERCTTCHLGLVSTDLGDRVRPAFRAHPSRLAHHLARRVGCTSCHGGTSQALTSAAAHAAPGSDQPDPRHRQPHIQASCARCHIPGAVAGSERLVDGARLFAGLGCAICHPLAGDGRGGQDFGPDLRTIGRRSLAYLRASLVDPTANFPESTMPSFADTFAGHEEELTDLLIFLESLVLPSPPGCRQHERVARLVEGSCADCHAGPAGRSGGRLKHRCPFILEHAAELRCALCHPGAVPEPGPFGGRCPAVERHRSACAACHPDNPRGALEEP